MIKWRGGSNLTSNKPGSDGDSKVEILPPVTNSVSQLSTDDRTLDFVKDARSKMGMLAKWNFDRQTQTSLQRVAGEIAVNYLNAQKEVMIDKIIVGVALAKRDSLAEFLRAAVEQDKHLLTLTNSAQKEMTDMIQDDVAIVLKEKKARFDKAKLDFENGELLKEDYDGLLDVHTQATEKLIADKFDRMDKIAQSYLDHFEQALKQYRERIFESGFMKA